MTWRSLVSKKERWCSNKDGLCAWKTSFQVSVLPQIVRFWAKSFLFISINCLMETSTLQRVPCISQWSTGFLQRAEFINTAYNLSYITEPHCLKQTFSLSPKSSTGAVTESCFLKNYSNLYSWWHDYVGESSLYTPESSVKFPSV